MTDPFTIVLVFVIGIVTGLVDSIVGVGGLISIPFLILSGLPPKVAIATDRVGIIGQNIGSLPKYWKERQILWKFVPPLTIVAAIAAYFGANILITLNEVLVTQIVGVVILLLLPFLFFKKELGIKRHHPGKLKLSAGYIVYFFAMIFASTVGGGVGILIMYVLLIFFGFTVINAKATDNFPWLFLSIASLIIFGINGIIDYVAGITLFAGMMIGGYIGAHVAVKKGNKWMKAFVVVAVVISGVKLLFF